MQWNFGEEKGTDYRTGCGGIVSLFISIATLIYFGNNLLAVIDYKGTNVLSSSVEDYFPEDVTFAPDDGFALAFAVYNFFEPFREIDYSEHYDIFATITVADPISGFKQEIIDAYKCSEKEIAEIKNGGD